MFFVSSVSLLPPSVSSDMLGALYPSSSFPLEEVFFQAGMDQ